jgi:hypothetical protein
MPKDGSIVFGDLVGKLDMIVVECTKCDRKGQYHLARLIEQHGRDAKLTDWRTYVARDCPRMKAASYSDQCGVRCPDLPKVL